MILFEYLFFFIPLAFMEVFWLNCMTDFGGTGPEIIFSTYSFFNFAIAPSLKHECCS